VQAADLQPPRPAETLAEAQLEVVPLEALPLEAQVVATDNGSLGDDC